MAIFWSYGSPMIEGKETDERPHVKEHPVKRRVTIADSIEMTQPTDQYAPAVFSPDGKKFVVITRKGNLQQNTVDYSLLLWKAEDVFQSRAPEVVLTMSSSSNLPAIQDVSWLPDNETIAFTGENPGELHQLYILSIRTRTLKKITESPTGVRYYSIAGESDRIAAAYVAEPIPENIWDEKARREGMFVSNQLLSNLLEGTTGHYGRSGRGRALFFWPPGRVAHMVATQDPIIDASRARPRALTSRSRNCPAALADRTPIAARRN